jgi:hypothetical protein
MVICTVLDALTVDIYAIVIVARVHDETSPFSPARRNVTSIILIQVLAEISLTNKTYNA